MSFQMAKEHSLQPLITVDILLQLKAKMFYFFLKALILLQALKMSIDLPCNDKFKLFFFQK